MFMPPKTYDCNIRARKLSKLLLVMHFIVYGKENKKNTLDVSKFPLFLHAKPLVRAIRLISCPNHTNFSRFCRWITM